MIAALILAASLTAGDSAVLVTIEHEWLAHAHDSVTLTRVLAADFVHVVPTGQIITKPEHIAWAVAHRPPPSLTSRFERLDIRLFTDTGIATGIVVASDGRRTAFTDVFVRRAGRWQAVSAQETVIAGSS